MFREVGGEFVRGGVGISDRPGNSPVPFQESQVVADGAIIEVEGGRELMSISRRSLEALKNPESIRSASGTVEEIPHQRTEARVQHPSGTRRVPLINPTSILTWDLSGGP